MSVKTNPRRTAARSARLVVRALGPDVREVVLTATLPTRPRRTA